MAEVVRNLYEAPNGQRYAWNGYEYVQVSRDFDPRSSAFMGGVSGAAGGIGAGVQQIMAAIAGDDLALDDLARERFIAGNEAAVLARRNPLAHLAGQATPYAAAAFAGGGLAGAAGAGSAGMAGTAAAADIGLAAASYGTPGERVLNAALGAAGYGLGVGAGAVGRAVRPRGRMADRVEAAVREPEIRGPGAGGTAQPVSPAEADMARSFAGSLLRVGSLQQDPRRLAQTARARRLAEQYEIPLTPAMRAGSPGMEQVEQALISNPWSAGPALRIGQQYMDILEDRARRFLLPGSEGPIDQDFLRAVSDDITKGYQEVAAASPAVNRDAIKQRAREIAAPDQESIWGDTEDRLFNKLLENLDREGGELSGQQAWNLQQRLADQAARKFRPDSGDYTMGTVYQAVADAIEFSLIDAAEGTIDPRNLNLLRKRYRVMRALERSRAFSRRDGLKMQSAYNALENAFPKELGQARGFPNPELEPLNELFDVLYVGNQLFRPIVGDSGTATRLALQDVTPQGIGKNMVRGIASALYFRQPSQYLPLAGTGVAAGAVGPMVVE